MAEIHCNQWWVIIFTPFGGGGAVTFGNHIFVRGSDASARMLAHEMCHVAQYTRYGIVGFLLRYMLGVVWSLLMAGWHRRRPSVMDNWLERECYSEGQCG